MMVTIDECERIETDDDNEIIMERDKFVRLPIEIVMDVMSYLSTSDRMCAGLVCKDWREATLCTEHVDKEVLVVRRRGSEDNLQKVVESMKNSRRPFFHIVFRDVELERSLPIHDLFGENIRSLVLTRCSLSEKTLVEILKCCKNLRELRINACRECLMLGRLLDNEKDVEEISSNFWSLVRLDLGVNSYLSDALFDRFVSVCPNLESLSLFDCRISFHSGLYKRFYPGANGGIERASESVLTFVNVLEYIKRRAKFLKDLNFGSTSMDGKALRALVYVDNLKLEWLRLPSCDQLASAGLNCLSHQTTLKGLDLSYCAGVTDASLACISQNLIDLESLCLRGCRGITDLGVLCLNKLCKLRTLDISECDQLTGRCIVQGLCEAPSEAATNATTKNIADSNNEGNMINEKFVNDRLKILSLKALDLDERSVQCLAMSFPQLRSLDLSYCFSAVTNKTLQTIFKELIWLRILRISRCDKVSDAGLTGMGAVRRIDAPAASKTVEKTMERPGSWLRIRLGSRAEKEILLDANQKREVLEMCEDSAISTDRTFCPGFSLIRLRGIRELDVSGCNRVTDVSLKHAFKFPELRVFDLSNCQQITHEGLDHLTRNNQAIEDLNLSQCHNINDIGILYVSRRLHRLKHLHLQSCSQLSDKSLEFIKLYCKSLQYLDVRDCRGISVNRMEGMSHLHVNYSERRDMAFDDNMEIPIPPPMRG